MKYFFILNPGSAGGRSRRAFPEVFDAACRRRISFDYEVCRSLEHARDLSWKANRARYDVVVAVGGDGTINSVLNGFYDDTGTRMSDAALGVLHTGTSPDFCRSHSIPCRLDAALDVLFDGCVGKIEVGKIRLAKRYDPAFDEKPVCDNGVFSTRYFACCANIGLGAAVARNANGGIRQRLGDSAGTFVSIVRSLAGLKQSRFSIIRDGVPYTVDRLVNLAVGKTFHVASGIKIRNDLEGNDGRLYCLTVHDLRLVDVVPCLLSLYDGKEIRENRFSRLDYCTSVHVLGNALRPEVECDGDPQGFLPCHIETAADRLDVIGASS
jgi:diacylglycerol kinase (ATP)